MDSKRFCVTYQDSTKLIKVQTVSFEEVKEKIRVKFQLAQPFSIAVKLDEFDQFVDIDGDDDMEMLEDAKHILVRKQSDFADVSVASCSGTSSADEFSGSEVCQNKNDLCFDVQAIIDNHPQGLRITEQYKKNGTISSESRMLLVSIVTANLVERYTFYPPADKKTMAAKSIVHAFPNLRNPLSKLGYEHFFSEAGGQSGYIQEKLKNMRRKLPSSSLQKPRKKLKVGPSPPTSKICTIPQKKFESDDSLPEDEENDLISFCRRASIENKEEIMNAMVRMYPNRQKWLHETSPCAHDVLVRYPRFKDIPALIDEEFKLMYGEETNHLISKWESRFVPAVLQMGKLSKIAKVNELIINLSNSTESPQDKQSMYAFFVMIHLLSVNPRKPSMEDLDKQLMDFKPVGTSVQHYLQTECETQRQPFLLCLGTIDDPQQFFVILDRDAIPCMANVTSAIDRLFKLHYVLNLEYSKVLKSFYAFLETCIYKISLPGNKLPGKVSELIANLSALKVEM